MPNYKLGDKVATRNAYGTALTKLADNNKRVVGLDGDMSNSTFSQDLWKKYPDQYVECFIAEQNMVGVGIGLGCRARAIPFVSTFAAFLTRAADQIRMGAVSFANIKYCGSHCGISIGEDGPSQMALEDLALFRAIPGCVVLYPSDAVSTEFATELVSNTQGIAFIRTGRPALPVVYENNEKFEIGKAKVIQTFKDFKTYLMFRLSNNLQTTKLLLLVAVSLWPKPSRLMTNWLRKELTLQSSISSQFNPLTRRLFWNKPNVLVDVSSPLKTIMNQAVLVKPFQVLCLIKETSASIVCSLRNFQDQVLLTLCWIVMASLQNTLLMLLRISIKFAAQILITLISCYK